MTIAMHPRWLFLLNIASNNSWKRRLMFVVWCYIVMLYNCYQTSDNSYMTAHVCCQMSDIRHLITVTVWCQMSNIRCLLSYNSYQTSDLWFYMLCYITVIRCLMSNIRPLIWHQMSDNSYMTAEVCCHLTVITRLMSDFIFYVI